MRGSGVRRSGCPEMKRVPRRSRFSLGAITQLTERRRERGRKRQSEKSQYSSIYKNIKNVKNVCMKMHEHVICNSKNSMGLA